MRLIKAIKQHDEKDCGAACLCTISLYFGKKYSFRYIREITHTGQNGVTLQGISEGAEKIGIKAEAYEATTEELIACLEKDKTPVIVHLRTEHFVVVYKSKAGKIYISDPGVGKYHVSKEIFDELWSGYVMMFTNQKSDKDLKEEMNSSHMLLNIIKSNWKGLLYIIFISWFLLSISVCSTYLFQVLLDYGNAGVHVYEHDASNIIINLLSHIANYGVRRLFVFMVILTVTMAIIAFFKGKAVAILSTKMDLSFMDEYAAKLFRAKISEIATRMTGDYISRTSDLVSVRNMISGLLVSYLLNVNLFVLGSILLCRINILLYSAAIVTLFLYCLLALILRKPLEVVYHAAMSANADVQTYLKESIQGIEMIKVNNLESNVQSQLMKKYKNFVEKIYKGNILGTYSESGSTFIEQISNLIIIFVGFEFVKNNKMSLGELMSFFMILSLLSDSSKQLLALQQSFQSGLVAVERLNDVRYMKEDSEGEISLKKINEIRLEKVDFSYFGRPPLFKDVSLLLDGKKKLAIVGKNGCGKSTLLRVIMGMEKASSGHVYINGVDIDKVKTRDMRDRIAFVTQNTFLFADTLLYNITLGKEYLPEEIERACEQAGLGDFVMQTPQGLDLFIDENAINLSSGQKQSIAIARALIRKPDVLILDEATSNMDADRENAVISHLMSLNIPCILVTHNNAIVAKADFVIDIGKEIE